MNLYQHAKNQAISLTCSEYMIDYKNLQSDWLRTFSPMSQEQFFSPKYRTSGTQQIEQICITEQIQYKLMTKFLNKFKKCCWLCQAQLHIGF